MSTHFWMMAGVTAAASAIMGLGLGGYATSPQRSALAEDFAIDAGTTEPVETIASSYTPQEDGPAVIRCTGCGPTLADRRWHADMAAMEDMGEPAMSDATDQSYREAEPILPEDARMSSIPAPMPQNVHLAAEDAPRMAPIQATSIMQSATAPPSVPAGTDGGMVLP